MCLVYWKGPAENQPRKGPAKAKHLIEDSAPFLSDPDMNTRHSRLGQDRFQVRTQART